MSATQSKAGYVARAALVAALVVSVLLATQRAANAATAIDPASTADDELADGYGRFTTGGAGGQTYWVTSLADSGPGTLRYGASLPGKRIIRFAVSGEIVVVKNIKVTSDKTIDGRGATITLRSGGLMLRGVNNVIVRNLRFAQIIGEVEDAVQVSGGTRNVWVTHNDFAGGEDGMVDITEGASEVTVSWNRFTNHVKVMLINSLQPNGQPARVTVHHNLFEGTSERHPFIQRANVHVYNNYFLDLTVHGIRSDEAAQLRSQNNVFQGTATVRGIVSKGVVPGRVNSTGDLLAGTATITNFQPTLVFNPALDYTAEVAPAGTALTDAIRRLAGRG